MSDHTPVFKPGTTVTFTTSAAVTGGQLLMNSGVNTVAPATTATIKYVGVAAHDAGSGKPVTVHAGVGTVHETVAQGAVTAGELLKVGTVAGSVATLGAGTFDQFVGVALTTAADGAVCRWKSVR